MGNLDTGLDGRVERRSGATGDALRSGWTRAR